MKPYTRVLNSAVLTVVSEWMYASYIMLRHRIGVLVALVILVGTQGNLRVVDAETIFKLGTYECPLKCNEQGILRCDGNASTNSEGASSLATRAWALYTDPLDMLDRKHRWMSFSTYFKLRMNYGKSPRDEVAFFILRAERTGSPQVFSILSGVGELMSEGLIVQFDTSENNIRNSSSNHVCASVGSTGTKVSRNANEVGIELAGGTSVHVWIDFHAVVDILEVRINLEQPKPEQAFVSYPLKLSDFSGSGLISVGFSGSNECNSIHYWTVDIYSEFSDLDFLKGIVIGVIGSLFPVALVILCRYCCWEEHRSRPGNSPPAESNRGYTCTDSQEEGICPAFSYTVIEKATNQFSHLLGEGGSGRVYLGELGVSEKEFKVAVKILGHQHTKDFEAEVSIISQLRHRYVVSLLGQCCEQNSKILIYEYVHNGSLDKFIFNPKPPARLLTWEERFKVVQHITDGLLYLHEGARQKVIHRDIKCSNIMLRSPQDKVMDASNMNAMFGDFGLSRMVEHGHSVPMTQRAGTLGYIAPEVMAEGFVTTQSDVYSLGIVLLEIVCGRKCLTNDGYELRKEVRRNSKSLNNVIDCKLRGESRNGVKEEAIRVLQLGIWCSHEDPTSRPSIRRVVSLLASKEKFSIPSFNNYNSRPNIFGFAK